MRAIGRVLLISAMSFSAISLAQTSEPQPMEPQPMEPQATQPTDTPTAAAVPKSGAVAAAPNAIIIPAGTRIPLSLKQAISTKNAREGDTVYAETVFPYVVNDRVVIPAGSYVQGAISHVERAKRVKGRAELLMRFTSIIYPSGYTVMLPGSVENTPGAENKGVKDSEGTIQQDSDKGKRVEDAAKGGAVGTVAGATAGGLATGGINGARVGAGAGAAAGVAWALLKHGSDLRLEVGTSIEMEIQRAITVDGARIAMAKATP